MIYNCTKFDHINIFWSYRKISCIFNLNYFSKKPQEPEVPLIGFKIWKASRDYSINKKNHGYSTFRLHLCDSWTINFVFGKFFENK